MFEGIYRLCCSKNTKFNYTTAYSKTWIVIEIALFKAGLNCNSHYVGSAYTLMKSFILHFRFKCKLRHPRVALRRENLHTTYWLTASHAGIAVHPRYIIIRIRFLPPISTYMYSRLHVGSSDRTNLIMFSRGKNFC